MNLYVCQSLTLAKDLNLTVAKANIDTMLNQGWILFNSVTVDTGVILSFIKANDEHPDSTTFFQGLVSGIASLPKLILDAGLFLPKQALKGTKSVVAAITPAHISKPSEVATPAKAA